MRRDENGVVVVVEAAAPCEPTDPITIADDRMNEIAPGFADPKYSTKCPHTHVQIFGIERDENRLDIGSLQYGLLQSMGVGAPAKLQRHGKENFEGRALRTLGRIPSAVLGQRRPDGSCCRAHSAPLGASQRERVRTFRYDEHGRKQVRFSNRELHLYMGSFALLRRRRRTRAKIGRHVNQSL